jgi:hypothetical protein
MGGESVGVNVKASEGHCGWWHANGVARVRSVKYILAFLLLLAGSSTQATIVNRCIAHDPSGLASISCGASGAQGSWNSGTGVGANHTLIIPWITYRGRNGIFDTLGLVFVDNVQFNFHTGGPSSNFMGITCALTGGGGTETIALNSTGSTFSDLTILEEDFIVPGCTADNAGAAVGTGAAFSSGNPTASSYTTTHTTYNICAVWGSASPAYSTAGTGYTSRFINPASGTDNAAGNMYTEDASAVAAGTITGTFVSSSGTVWMIVCASYVTTSSAGTARQTFHIISFSGRARKLPWDDRKCALQIVKA